MKFGLIGLPQSGKSTVFSALTGVRGEGEGGGSTRSGQKIATVMVYDRRVDFLQDLFKPKKTTYAKIEYRLPVNLPSSDQAKSAGEMWSQVRICDGLLHVVRNFKGPGGSEPQAENDFWQLEEEIILNDLVVTEKRLERIELDKKRGKKPEGDEQDLLLSCRESLENNQPLRNMVRLTSQPELKGFTFLSAKPMLVIVNNEDEDERLPQWDRPPEDMDLMVVRGRLEMDIAGMTPEEALEFRDAYHILESAFDRVIKSSYALLNQISFFTVISDEVRAWSITAGTPALEAADAVHSDMKRGFIRAEVLSFDDLQAHGNFQEAKKAGLVRLEGKEYVVKDGDIINFRFNI